MSVCTLSNWIIGSEIIFSILCLFCSVICWVVFFNLNRLEGTLTALESQVQTAQMRIIELEKQIKVKKIDYKEIILDPKVILKIIELFTLFKAKKLTKLLLLKTIFNGK